MDELNATLKEILAELKAMNKKMDCLSDGGYTVLDVCSKLDNLLRNAISLNNNEEKKDA